ncbi:MAG: hypothetical protein K9M08_02270 [Pirellula sp.]|nr:hypothetical protein [Pirellula sp.]
MSFLALPSSTVLVQRVVWLHMFKASGAYKDPPLRFIDSNTVKNIVRLLATLTGLGSNAFYWHMTVANALSSDFLVEFNSLGTDPKCRGNC